MARARKNIRTNGGAFQALPRCIPWIPRGRIFLAIKSKQKVGDAKEMQTAEDTKNVCTTQR
jgi:hypothetical protein